MKITYKQIAENENLWNESVDHGAFDKDFFSTHTVEEKIGFIEKCFGKENIDEE